MVHPVRDLRPPQIPADATGPASGPPPDGVSLRPLHALDEFHACVDLQRAVWGADFADIVPASLLLVSTHVGGLLLGAFTDDRLAGFVFGLTGMKDDEVVHWSHMLGVRADLREMGIGRALKEYQRAELARRGIAREFWTFDPLQARNAHLNINRLGVRVIDYVENMYGTTGSPLHFGLATDRLIVECATANRPRLATAPTDTDAELPVLTPIPQAGDTLVGDDRPPAALIEIPSDVQALLDTDPRAVGEWRAATRAHFHFAFANGYRVAAFHRDRTSARSFYVILRDAEEEA